jgi:hypothetical protein
MKTELKIRKLIREIRINGFEPTEIVLADETNLKIEYRHPKGYDLFEGIKVSYANGKGILVKYTDDYIKDHRKDDDKHI